MQLSISTEDIKVSDKKLLYLQNLPGSVNFLHSSWYGAVLFIRAENTVDNSGVFSLLLSSTHTQSRSFLFFTLPQKEGGWGSARTWQGTQLGQLTLIDQRDIPEHMETCSAYKEAER